MAIALMCIYGGKNISVEDAIALRDTNPNLADATFKCVECGEYVRPHRGGGKARAHFEHLDRNPNCSLSHKDRQSAEDVDIEVDADNEWKPQELRAAVEAYVEMQRNERKGLKVAKKRYYEALSKRFGRTEQSYSYRMRNISYVLSLMGREWLSGLKPAQNVGTAIAVQLESMINEVESRMAPVIVEFELRTREELKGKSASTPSGNLSPKSTTASITQYQRDPSVKAWVLRHAKGLCECCGHQAPFNGSDGLPFLEVHHVQQLSDKGPDTISNAVALCPNCHREIHYGLNAKQLVEKLYVNIARLVR